MSGGGSGGGGGIGGVTGDGSAAPSTAVGDPAAAPPGTSATFGPSTATSPDGNFGFNASLGSNPGLGNYGQNTAPFGGVSVAGVNAPGPSGGTSSGGVGNSAASTGQGGIGGGGVAAGGGSGVGTANGSTGGNAGGVAGGGYGGMSPSQIAMLVNSPTQPYNVFNESMLSQAKGLGYGNPAIGYPADNSVASAPVGTVTTSPLSQLAQAVAYSNAVKGGQSPAQATQAMQNAPALTPAQIQSIMNPLGNVATMASPFGLTSPGMQSPLGQQSVAQNDPFGQMSLGPAPTQNAPSGMSAAVQGFAGPPGTNGFGTPGGTPGGASSGFGTGTPGGIAATSGGASGGGYNPYQTLMGAFGGNLNGALGWNPTGGQGNMNPSGRG